MQEIHLLTLWVRTWGEKLVVELDVDPDTGSRAGCRASCLGTMGRVEHRSRRSRRRAGPCLSGCDLESCGWVGGGCERISGVKKRMAAAERMII